MRPKELPGQYRYSVYGLVVSSALPLPELTVSTEARADVHVRLGHVGWTPPESKPGEGAFQVIAGDGLFFWDQLGKFMVRGGSEIVVDPLPHVEDRMLRLPLLGTILAFLLYQRGFLVLHASSVAINNRAIAFIGNKGWGKSTVAASLYQRGHLLVADDVVPVRINGTGQPLVPSGFPQFKLYPESATASLGVDAEPLPWLAPGYDKRACPARDRFLTSTFPLGGIYLLAVGPALKLRELRPQEALIHLVEHSYIARYGKRCLQGANATAHFRQCETLLERVPVYRLERPASLSLVPEIARVVEEHHSNHEKVLECASQWREAAQGS